MEAQNRTALTETFDLLADPHRRYVLYYLTREAGVVDLDTLAAAIANWDKGEPVTGRGNDREAIATSLRHAHLPKLAAAGIITFDATTGAIELDGTNGHDQFIAEAARIDGYTQPVAGE